jgi:hypothetical protein
MYAHHDQYAALEIAVGVNDVWGVKTFNNVFRYNPVSRTFNSDGGNTAQVTAGGDGVWIVDTSDHIWRFDSSSASFIQVPGVLKGIAAGSGGGVFGINTADQVFTFVRP